MASINKRGQDLSIGTLILIVLGIIVLVLLVLGFSIGWSNLFEKINIFGGGSSIGDVVTACNLAVTSQNQFDYCQNFRKIKVSGQTEYVNCENRAVQQGLQGQGINCGTPPAEGITPAYESWAKWYCEERLNKGLNKITKETKVNDINCRPSSG